MRRTVLTVSICAATLVAAPIAANAATDWGGWIDKVSAPDVARGVHVEFQVPTVDVKHTTINNGYNEAAFWAGLGGTGWPNNEALLQAGVSLRVLRGGKPSYYAWWEQVPASGKGKNSYDTDTKYEVRLGDVSPGDYVDVKVQDTAHLIQHGNSWGPDSDWFIEVQDYTKNKVWVRSASHLNLAHTAEAVIERPELYTPSGKKTSSKLTAFTDTKMYPEVWWDSWGPYNWGYMTPKAYTYKNYGPNPPNVDFKLAARNLKVGGLDAGLFGAHQFGTTLASISTIHQASSHTAWGFGIHWKHS